MRSSGTTKGAPQIGEAAHEYHSAYFQPRFFFLGKVKTQCPVWPRLAHHAVQRSQRFPEQTTNARPYGERVRVTQISLGQSACHGGGEGLMSDNGFAAPFVYKELDPLEIDGAQRHHATVCTVDDIAEARQFDLFAPGK